MWRIAILGLPFGLAALLSILDIARGRLTLILTVGITFLFVSFQVTLAERAVLVPASVTRGLFFVAIVPLAIRVFFHTIADWRRVCLSGLQIVGLFFGSALPWVYPLFVHRSTLFGAPFANANNDLAIYVVSADNFMNAGFAEFGRVVGYQAGALANFEVAGSSSLITAVAHITDAPVWRVVTLTMLLVLVLTTICCFELARVIGLSVTTSVLVATLANIAPWSATIPQNFFLSQAIARLALVAGLLFIAYVVRATSTPRLVAGLFGLWAAAWVSLVAYPSGTIVSVVFACLMLPALIGIQHPRDAIFQLRTILQRLSLCVVAVALVFPFVVSRRSLIFSNISWYSKANITGWPAPTNILPKLLGIPTSFGSGSIVFVVGSLSMLGIMLLRQRRTVDWARTLSGTLMFTGVLSIYLLVSSRVGVTSYQTWKTLATVQFAVPISLGLFLSSLPTGRSKHIFFRSSLIVCAAVVFANAYSVSATYRDVTQLPTMELENASKDPRLPQSGLLIGLRPYLETMIAPVILDVKDAVYAADTYLGPGSVDPMRCSIMRGQGGAETTQVTPTLYLIPNRACLQISG